MKRFVVVAIGALLSLPAMAAVPMPVPEGDSFSLLAIGLAGVAAVRLMRK